MKQLSLALALAACPFAAHALTPDELAGTWCYSHYEAGGEREQQNIAYEFNEDGTLLYQNSPTAALDSEGSFEIDGESIRIKPMFMMFNLTVKSASADELVLEGMGEHVFVRGECR